MNWEIARLKDSFRTLDRRLKCEHRDGALETLARYTDEESLVAWRYLQTFLDGDNESRLIRN